MAKPRWITFTGLDARTDMERAADLAMRYPVEWGVLFGGRLGKNRYPDERTVQEIESWGCPMSAHLCGPLAAEANEGTPPVDYAAYQRIQVNRARGCYDYSALESLSRLSGRYVVAQHRTEQFPAERSGIQWLQDTSGGKGAPARFWATPENAQQLVGYAGGLHPENVATEVAKMPAEYFWIDMETGVRTDDWLDLDKCEAVCRAVYG